eukprot:CAMPEP_0202884276 /NCGR_PEP_ID=MMETSP1391-20130828/40683_1 /ASSEMBLY_ACC=CAM_ASM_000867 /TAXON_ID=1034604 /ORGANISM="Chlamydomonas leiostraca, Strain SAG 11-49" /LENGTH=250 /DNA_ID=CAMNT_0049567431 /DNA_START=217 /DNA_END=965 /DNA_ORIENTATION=+
MRSIPETAAGADVFINLASPSGIINCTDVALRETIMTIMAGTTTINGNYEILDFGWRRAVTARFSGSAVLHFNDLVLTGSCFVWLPINPTVGVGWLLQRGQFFWQLDSAQFQSATVQRTVTHNTRLLIMRPELYINVYTMLLSEVTDQIFPGLLDAKSWIFGSYLSPNASISDVTMTSLTFERTVTPANRAENFTITTEIAVGGRRLSYQDRTLGPPRMCNTSALGAGDGLLAPDDVFRLNTTVAPFWLA